MFWWVIILITPAAFFAVMLYGRMATRSVGSASTAFRTDVPTTLLDRTISAITSRHPHKVGLRLLTDNVEAFATRAAVARMAERSLDLQYYYWKDDLTGGLLASELLDAADRGVRVRLLLDDINALGRDSNYRALDRHPNIEVRLYNPLRCREGAFLRGLEMVVRFWRVNRRMHNKAWIADGRVAIVGGRNIGDAYFDASEESNFRDMDVSLVGPAVQEAEQMFDRFWNSEMVSPIRNLADWLHRADLARLRRRLRRRVLSKRSGEYLGRVDDALRSVDSGSGMHWTADAAIVSDPPEKCVQKGSDGGLVPAIRPILSRAERSIQITSPYFIPLESGVRMFLDLAGKGVRISVLTNSLAATDVTAVHGAYSRFRKKLLQGGVRLFELRARHGKKNVSLFGSRGASLHTKAFVVDGQRGFIGSFNFDPRSASLNTEMGVLFDHAGLGREMQSVFAEETEATHSYRVVLRNGATLWHDDSGIVDHEPDATVRRRALAGLVSVLPVESQL